MAENKGRKKIKIKIKTWFCFLSLPPITVATLQSLWAAHLVFTYLKLGSQRITTEFGWGIFSFQKEGIFHCLMSIAVFICQRCLLSSIIKA